MNRIHHIRRLAAALAGMAGALLAFAAAAHASLHPLPPGWNKHPPPLSHGYLHYSAPGGPALGHTHIVVTGGMPGWQIALIAAGAALLAAAVTVLVARAWGARRRVTPTAA